MKIPIKRYVMDENLSWEERYRQLEVHHEEETKFLLSIIPDEMPEGDPWLFPTVDTSNLEWHDGPLVDANVIECRPESSDVRYRYLLELRFSPGAIYRKASERGSFFVRLGVNGPRSLQDLLDRVIRPKTSDRPLGY